MERDSKLAIAGSLLWVVLATGIILGTHGQATAAATDSGVADRTGTEWLVHPVSDDGTAARLHAFRQC